MSGPNSTSTIPPKPHEDGPKQSDHIREISGFVLAHIISRNGRGLPGYSLDLGNNLKFHVMRWYLSHRTEHGADFYVSDPYDFDAIDELEDVIKKHDFTQELVIACDVNGETMHLHISKNQPFNSLHSDEMLRKTTRSHVIRSLSAFDLNNPDPQ